jgi:hypothetical protein
MCASPNGTEPKAERVSPCRSLPSLAPSSRLAQSGQLDDHLFGFILLLSGSGRARLKSVSVTYRPSIGRNAMQGDTRVQRLEKGRPAGAWRPYGWRDDPPAPTLYTRPDKIDPRQWLLRRRLFELFTCPPSVFTEKGPARR